MTSSFHSRSEHRTKIGRSQHNEPRHVEQQLRSKNTPHNCEQPVSRSSSVTALLHDFADAEVDLQPRRAPNKVQHQKRRNLQEVHREERARVVSMKDGICSLKHIRDAELEAILRLPESRHEEELVHHPIPKGVRVGDHDLRIARRCVLRVRHGSSKELVTLESADSTVDPRVTLDGHQVACCVVHEVQGELPCEVHRLAQP
eukprot:CAMPEP_0204136120 /NCGR_PEP_ID=MMETSP0361-20130328/16651_1 /ASSEMBLY_ACC=CAM_ASM_000343 /TAXON_ID=268821 /ORGANISM="Scrippsiella Hangoei, Strain SHTV-5" /LENGTH=201 /DNA_ID=CAMNT_0051089597 /DNA_START=462 /DNA_END=1063 /DNA_ORIENTATION=+